MYPYHGSSSSFSPSVSLLCQLMEGEKQEAKKWLSGEMNRLVEPLIDGLVQQITTRLTAAENRNQTGDYGFHVQGRDMFHQAHTAQVHPSQVYPSMHPQQINSPQVHPSQMNPLPQMHPPQMYPPQINPQQMHPPQQYQLDQANLHPTQQLHNSTLPFADGHLQLNQGIDYHASNVQVNSNELTNGLIQQPLTTNLTTAQETRKSGDCEDREQERDMFHPENPPQMNPPQQYQHDQAKLHTTQQLHNSTLPFADGHLQSNQASNANSNGLTNGLVQQPLTTNLTTAQETRKSGDYEERVQEGDKFHPENPPQGQHHEYQLDQANLNSIDHDNSKLNAAAVQLSNQSPNVQVNPVKEAQNASWLSAPASYDQSPNVQLNLNEIDYLETEPLNQTSHEPITDQAPPSPSCSSASTIVEQSNLANDSVENEHYSMDRNDGGDYNDHHHQSNEPVPSDDRDNAQVDEETEVEDNGDDGDNVIEVIERDEHELPKRGRPKKNSTVEPQPRNLKPNPDKQIIVLSLRCFQCTQMFDNKSKLNAHLHNQHKMFPNRCLVRNCRQSFCTSTLLNKHTKQDHSNIIKWQCSKCLKHYTTNQALASHDYQIHQFGRFQCALPNCEFTGKTRKPLYDHFKKMHEQNNAALFMCEHPGCGRGFRELAKLKKHLQDAVHYGDANGKPYRCKWLTCVYASDDRAATIEHIKRLHFRLDESSPTYENDQLAEKYLEVVGGARDDDDDENDQPSNGQMDDSARVELIEVEEDGDNDGNDVIEEPSPPTKRPRLDTTENPNNGESNSTNLQLTRPEATTNIPQKSVNNQKLITLSLDCLQSDCPQTFKDRTELNAHMSSVHHILQSRCLVKGCHQSFNTFRVPSNHFTQDHSNIKKNEWPCDKCPKLCISSHRLSIHDYTFHQHGHFQCAYPNCDFTGTKRQKVYVHVNLQHKMSKFKCEQPGCSLEFSGIARLKKHQQDANHHGDIYKKPYRCKWLSCDYASAERDATIEHIKRMHFLLLDPQSSPKEDALAMKYLEVLQRQS